MDLTIYDEMSSILNRASGSAVGFMELIACAPYFLPPGRPDGIQHTIREYQRVLVETWLSDAWPDDLRAPVWAAPVPREAFTDVPHEYLMPAFFRTDESPTGEIYEIQCPGGWWGITHALQTVLGYSGGSLSRAFAEELRHLFPAGTRILHLFDTAGLPHESMYFAHAVRAADERVRYRGIDGGIMPADCNFIRSHSYPSLVAEDLFRLRIRQIGGNGIRFDHPPLPIFDQKLPMCLPFHPETAPLFTDAHRQLFPYSALVLKGKIRLESGDIIGVDEFIRLSPEDRRFFLKYAGTDSTRNYGSRAVHRLADLSPDQLARLFGEVARDAARGEPWMIQREVRHQDDITFLSRDGARRTATLTGRISSFYGPTRPLGKLFLASPETAVHGSQSTVLSLVQERR
jgi:hypothetical protein